MILSPSKSLWYVTYPTENVEYGKVLTINNYYTGYSRTFNARFATYKEPNIILIGDTVQKAALVQDDEKNYIIADPVDCEENTCDFYVKYTRGVVGVTNNGYVVHHKLNQNDWGEYFYATWPIFDNGIHQMNNICPKYYSRDVVAVVDEQSYIAGSYAEGIMEYVNNRKHTPINPMAKRVTVVGNYIIAEYLPRQHKVCAKVFIIKGDIAEFVTNIYYKRNRKEELCYISVDLVSSKVCFLLYEKKTKNTLCNLANSCKSVKCQDLHLS